MADSPTNKKRRADELLADSGLVDSPREAQARIMAGTVIATDPRGREHKVKTAGEPLRPGTTFRLKGARHPYVSRGGLKLAAGLDALQIDPRDLRCADLGVSTGGFTDCLVQRGARHVVAVDVSYGLTAWRIRTDERVDLRERTNVRHLSPDALAPVDLLVADLSFIGLVDLLEGFARLVLPGGRLVLLVKPQFEAPRQDVEDGGVVTREAVRQAAVASVVEAGEAAGCEHLGTVESPITGATGNVEYLVGMLRK